MIWWKNAFCLLEIWESFLTLLRMRVSGKSVKFKIGDKIMSADISAQHSFDCTS